MSRFAKTGLLTDNLGMDMKVKSSLSPFTFYVFNKFGVRQSLLTHNLFAEAKTSALHNLFGVATL